MQKVGVRFLGMTSDKIMEASFSSFFSRYYLSLRLLEVPVNAFVIMNEPISDLITDRLPNDFIPKVLSVTRVQRLISLTTVLILWI